MTSTHDPRGGSFPAKHAAKNKEQQEAAENAVPSGTITEVKDWVGDDKERAQRALDAENANDKPRKTLVADLEDTLNG